MSHPGGMAHCLMGYAALSTLGQIFFLAAKAIPMPMRFSTEGPRLIGRLGHETIQIEAWGRDSLRLRATTNAAIRDDLPGGLLDPAPQRARIDLSDSAARIESGRIRCDVNAEGDLCFYRDGVEALSEAPIPFVRRAGRVYRAGGGELFQVDHYFRAYEGERLYGLGQHQHGLLDQKGAVIDLVQRNMEVCIPFLLSNRGYGLLWNHPGTGRVELGTNRVRWSADAAAQIDLWITVGDGPSDILAKYADATGHAPDFPHFASGFWQCRLRYRNQQELLTVAREHKNRGLPLSVIVIDFFNSPMHGDWRFREQDWPDPSAMVQELRGMGVEVMVSTWPTVNPISPNYQTMREQGYFVRTERGVAPLRDFADYTSEGWIYLAMIDSTHPGAREFLWERLQEGYYRHGVRLFWLDANEPEFYPEHHDNLRYHIGQGAAVSSIYPLMHARAFHEGLAAEGETEILTLNRSAWAGSQRYGVAVWSGDVQSSWEALRAQVPAGLNIGLSGIPWWTHDTGGFWGGDPQDEAFRELLLRWFQFGCFTPIFRLHGMREPAPDILDSAAPNEIWSYGPELYEHFRFYLNLRERLRPYIMAQMALASERGLPLMRPAFVDYPDDSELWALKDQYLFGPDLLVAPVLHPGAESREVRLPAGARWIDAWRGVTHDGGQALHVRTPKAEIPLFIRVGGSQTRAALFPVMGGQDR